MKKFEVIEIEPDKISVETEDNAMIFENVRRWPKGRIEFDVTFKEKEDLPLAEDILTEILIYLSEKNRQREQY